MELNILIVISCLIICIIGLSLINQGTTHTEVIVGIFMALISLLTIATIMSTPTELNIENKTMEHIDTTVLDGLSIEQKEGEDK